MIRLLRPLLFQLSHISPVNFVFCTRFTISRPYTRFDQKSRVLDGLFVDVQVRQFNDKTQDQRESGNFRSKFFENSEKRFGVSWGKQSS